MVWETHSVHYEALALVEMYNYITWSEYFRPIIHSAMGINFFFFF
jgi:hypothetical protein